MKKTIDAMGKECPIPVIIAKKEIEKNHSEFDIKVDNDIAVQNLKKLAASKSYTVHVAGGGDEFNVSFTPDGEEEACGIMTDDDIAKVPVTQDWVIFMGKNYVGEGEFELGNDLAKMFFYSLTQEEDLPSKILFMNSGVRLAVQDEQIIGHLEELQSRGVKILVCGTCLNYYGLKDKLQVGEVSNMYEIADSMFKAGKVITV